MKSQKQEIKNFLISNKFEKSEIFELHFLWHIYGLKNHVNEVYH